MKLAIGYSSKDQVELTKQTLLQLMQSVKADIYWGDGSSTEEGKAFIDSFPSNDKVRKYTVRGGADAAIAWKLTEILEHPEYSHIGLLENDVLLDEDWFEPTMELFEKGKTDGLV